MRPKEKKKVKNPTSSERANMRIVIEIEGEESGRFPDRDFMEAVDHALGVLCTRLRRLSWSEALAHSPISLHDYDGGAKIGECELSDSE